MTQGVYGLVASFLILMKIGLFGNTEYLTNMGVLEGGFYLMAALPIAIAGLISAIHQGRTAATGVNLVGKRPGSMGHGITAAALVETYAIFALLITLLLVMRSPFAA
jgi:V/A-type H+-transporting ATPase subunit K